MWGVGPATEARLAEIGVTTIGQLAKSSPQSVERLLGHAAGRQLTSLAWNRDPRQIQPRQRAHSAGAQSALGRQPAIERVFKPTLHHLADRIGARLRAKSLAGRTITVRVRFADLRSVTRALTLSAPISATRALAEVAEDLVRGVLADHGFLFRADDDRSLGKRKACRTQQHQASDGTNKPFQSSSYV